MSERELLNDWLLGDVHAVQFCEALFKISQIWDDLIDERDKASNDDINQAFWLALAVIPTNPFYLRNGDHLQPLIQKAILDWMDANQLEQLDDHEKNIAFVLRDTVSTIVLDCARLIGGYEWARSISMQVRKAIYDETLSDYKELLQ